MNLNMAAPLQTVYGYVRPLWLSSVLLSAIRQHVILIEITGRSMNLRLDVKRQEKQSTAMKHTTQDVREDFPQYYVKMLFGAVCLLQGKHVSGSLRGKTS